MLSKMIYHKSNNLLYYTLNEKYESRLSDILNSKLIHIYYNPFTPYTAKLISKITNLDESNFMYRLFLKWEMRKIQDLKESTK